MAKLNKWQDVIDKTNEGYSLAKGSTDPFDISFADEEDTYKKDRDTNKRKDGYSTGVESYLARKKSHKKTTPTTYNDSEYVGKKPFSSPPAQQQIAAPTNTGEMEGFGAEALEYNDPVISTKPTPTSEKLGLPRPGPSSFIQTARYNPQTKRLNIQYTDGKIFPYENVSPELADSILEKRANHSPGQELLNTIFYGHGTTKADEIADINDGM